MSDRNLLTLLAISDRLADIGATIEEILDNSGYTLGEAMAVAARVGMDPEMDYRKIPLIPASALDEIRRRILTERAEMAGIDADLEVSFDEVDASVPPHEDKPCGYVLTEAGAAALDMLEHRAKVTAQASVVKEHDRQARGHFPPLPYMTKFHTGGNLYYGADRYRTPHVTIPLREYPAYWDDDADDDGMVQLAAVRVGLVQQGNNPYPLVEFERMSGDDGSAEGPFARYELHLDEARELAHALLLLLDVASGVSDGSTEGER
ncbi:hypothetical protein [Rhodococcus aetherivorans]|uniref:hypothetical protein n=1 Tax=Rhodococcus aetherivorans TaxID=191292 RepID=UPI00241CCEBB|nr:hypothetical protein [Rhodococcus aetherivorans]WFS11849.1 hypothetical protein P9K37_18820 [Rhodococcus aetherivorans]